jgi:RES domain-containing protein
MATLYIPDDLEVVEVEAASLPNNWKTNLSSTQSKGEEFLLSNKAPILKVPSAIVEDEYNFLINPLHKEASRVQIVEVKPFNFDDRLITS